jgi:hypothetical protein
MAFLEHNKQKPRRITDLNGLAFVELSDKALVFDDCPWDTLNNQTETLIHYVETQRAFIAKFKHGFKQIQPIKKVAISNNAPEAYFENAVIHNKAVFRRIVVVMLQDLMLIKENPKFIEQEQRRLELEKPEGQKQLLRTLHLERRYKIEHPYNSDSVLLKKSYK